MRKLTYLLALIISIIFTISLMARQPAVEPVMGLSIEDEKPISPKTAKGYKFKPNFQKANRELAHNKHSNEGIKEVTLDSNSGAIPIVFILFLTLLPIVLWFTIIRGLKASAKNSEQEIPSNVAFLKDYKSEEDPDDNGIKKAS